MTYGIFAAVGVLAIVLSVLHAPLIATIFVVVLGLGAALFVRFRSE